MRTSLAFVALVLASLQGVVAAQRTALSIPDEMRRPLAAYAMIGDQPGSGRLQIVERQGVPEIVLNGSDIYTPFWHALRFDAERAMYVDRMVSPVIGTGVYSCVLRSLARGNFLPGSAAELALFHIDWNEGIGLVQIVDETDGATLLEFETSDEIMDGEGADLDGDGLLELVLACENGLFVFAGDGTPIWSLPVTTFLYQNNVTVAQLDDDPALEIATAFGPIVDGSTFEVQWDTGFFAQFIAAGQLDADRPQELVIAKSFGEIRAFDVDVQQVKWSTSNFNTSALRLADLDGDGFDELLVGDEQGPGITIKDGVSLAQEGFLQNPAHGVTDIQVGDVDRDGELEIVWGTGRFSTLMDQLIVSDAATLATEWRSPAFGGPLVGPGRGDVDGDGSAEIVVASSRGRFGIGGGPQLVFLDEHDLVPLATVAPLSNTGAEIHDLVLSDVDGDGDGEVVLAGQSNYTGFVRIFDVGDSFALDELTAAFSPFGSSFRSVELADADGNGVREILAASGGESSGSPGNRVYAFDPATGVELRRSASFGTTFQRLEDLVVGDLDGDGVTEVAAHVRGGSLAVLNGTTLATEAVLPGAFTALARTADGLWLGEQDGSVRLVAYDGAAFSTLYARDLGERAVTGLTPRARGRWFVATDGLLSLYSAGFVKRLWHTEDYGPEAGRRAVPVLPDKSLVTCGKFGVFAFAER